MKDLKDWAAVQKVYKQTKSKRATADVLGIARNTVRKLFKKRRRIMRIPIYQIDTFTNIKFERNPAAVCPLEAWIKVKQ